jgi:trans-aconitate methyltransferase
MFTRFHSENSISIPLPNRELKRPPHLSLYEQSFNGPIEFPAGGPICLWDFGCGPGTTVATLQDNYPEMRIVGVDRNRYPLVSSPIPIIHERMEDIDAIVSRAQALSAYPPDIITARNSLYYYLERGVNADKLFDGIAGLLNELKDAKLLVFDNMQDRTYEHYRRLAQLRGLSHSTLPVFRNIGNRYLKITAQPS